MRRYTILFLCGTFAVSILLFVPLIGSLVAPSAGCYLGKVGAQDNPCRQQEATLERLSFLATREHLVAKAAQTRVAELSTRLAPTRVPTRRPTSTAFPTTTLDAAAFDISKATPITNSSGTFSMPLPPGWYDISGNSPDQFRFAYGSYGDSSSALAQLRVFVIEHAELTNLLDLKEAVGTTESAINNYKADLSPTDYQEIGEVIKSNIGEYEGFALTYVVPPRSQGGSPNATYIELRLADIPNTTKTIALVYFADGSVWEQVKGVLGQMIDGMVFNPQNIPTATPSATIHPLEKTATYVQTLIIGLTASPTKLSPP